MKLLRSSFIRHTGLLFSGSFLAQAIGFGITFVLSRIYSPEDFGGLGIFNSIVSVWVVFAALRFEMAIVVEDDPKRALHLTQLSLLLNLATGALILILVLFLKDPIAEWLNISQAAWLYLVPLVVCASGMIETLVFWRNREKHYRRISSNRILTAGLAAGGKTAYPYALAAGNGLIWGHTLGQFIGVLHLWYRSGIHLFQFDLRELRQVARDYRHFPLFSAPAALVNVLAVRMPYFVLAYFLGEGATGHLDNASRLTYLPMSMLAMAASQVFFERIARDRKERKISAKLAHELLNFLFLLGVIPVLAMLFFGDRIIPFLLGEQWTDAGTMVQILILFYFSMFLTAPFSSAFETYNKLKVQLLYNLFFLAATSAALLIGFSMHQGFVYPMLYYASTGMVLRLVILNYFFHLLGSSAILKTLFGILALGLVIWAGDLIFDLLG